MAIYYLDIDDEITSAAARLRDSSDSRIALVLSTGSRVATSRINFRLLAREAKRRNKRLAIIAADPSVQSVARSAELPVYSSVSEYERAEAVVAAHSAGPVGAALDELALTVGPGTPGYIGRTGATRVTNGRPATPPPPQKKAGHRGVLLASSLLLVAAIAAAGFFFLPGTNVVLTLREDPIGPITLNVTVDTAVTTVNTQSGTVPGQSKAFPLQASDTFNATGEKSVDTPATGTVTFSSLYNFDSVTIVSGTVVSTPAGVSFATTSTVTAPKASSVPQSNGTLLVTPSTVNAPVKAVKSGVAGNVPAGAITVVPPAVKKFAISVKNKAETSGGTHTVVPLIQQSDIDGAQAGIKSLLQKNLEASFESDGSVPAGMTLFPESAKLGDATCAPDPTGLVGTTAPTFDLDCHATGTAIVADMSKVLEIAGRRAAAAVKSGYTLVASSVSTAIGKAVVHGSSLSVPVVITAGEVPIVDVDELRAAIKGKSIDAARTFLSQFGQVEISAWPDWGSNVSGFDFRIDIQVIDVSPAPSQSPSATTRKTAPPPTQLPDVTYTPGPSGTPEPTPEPTDTPAPTDTAPPTEGPSPSPSPS